MFQRSLLPPSSDRPDDGGSKEQKNIINIYNGLNGTMKRYFKTKIEEPTHLNGRKHNFKQNCLDEGYCFFMKHIR
jgi:hypothetical protein